MQYDDRTGLPELPEGFFWRVEPVYSPHSGYRLSGMYVRLMERRRFRSAVGLYRREVGLYVDPNDQREHIKKAAETMFEWFENSGTALKFVGDYPPNNINK